MTWQPYPPRHSRRPIESSSLPTPTIADLTVGQGRAGSCYNCLENALPPTVTRSPHLNVEVEVNASAGFNHRPVRYRVFPTEVPLYAKHPFSIHFLAFALHVVPYALASAFGSPPRRRDPRDVVERVSGVVPVIVAVDRRLDFESVGKAAVRWLQ